MTDLSPWVPLGGLLLIGVGLLGIYIYFECNGKDNSEH